MAGWLENCIVAEIEPDSICWMCRDLTPFIEVNFEAPLCSEACYNEAWAMFDRDNYKSAKSDFEEHPERWEQVEGGIRRVSWGFSDNDVDFDL